MFACSSTQRITMSILQNFWFSFIFQCSNSIRLISNRMPMNSIKTVDATNQIKWNSGHIFTTINLDLLTQCSTIKTNSGGFLDSHSGNHNTHIHNFVIKLTEKSLKLNLFVFGCIFGNEIETNMYRICIMKWIKREAEIVWNK